ncbi:MAG: IPT/TIG domain-containing protein [Terriglobia bacterium]|nr:IPT/TIG domain-containing protein [Terriglobia bacterium]
MWQISRFSLLGILLISLTGTLFAAVPTISSLSVTSGTVGTSVTINGSNFGNSQGSSTVTFNGVAAIPTSWNKTKIVTTVPPDATTGLVKVTVSGTASNGLNFTVVPHITSLSPSSGHTGDALTISGSGFGPVRNASTVAFGSAGATVNSWASGSIVVVVPQQPGSSVVVTVNGTASNSTQFTLLPGPSITGLSLTSGPVGTPLTVSGANFGGTPGSITFNGMAATPTSWSDSSIGVAVPAGATTGNVVVTAYGAQSNGVQFTVTPYIGSLSPISGTVGTPVTIMGTSFGVAQGSSTVSFNGTLAIPTSWGDNSITTPVPTGATAGNVVVTVGGVQSNGIAFTVTQVAPNISTVSPTMARVNDGVLITGTNFGATQGSSTVTFNGTSAPITDWEDTSITVGVPSGATTGNIVITVNGQNSNGISFTVMSDSAPYIASISPDFGGKGTPVTIIGLNFGATKGSSSVTFNSMTANTLSWSDTAVTAAVPAGATAGDILINVNGVQSNGMGFNPNQLQDDTVITPVYQPIASTGTDSYIQKKMAVGIDGFTRFVTGDSTSSGYDDQIAYVRCLDADCTTFHTAKFTIGQWTDAYAIALGPDGFARIAYKNFGNEPPAGADSTVGLIQCADDDCTSYTNTTVDGASNNQMLSIAVGSDGTSNILYDYGRDYCDYYPFQTYQGVGLASCSQGGGCSLTQITPVHCSSSMAGTITMGSGGSPAFAYVIEGVWNYGGQYWVVPNSLHYYSDGSDTTLGTADLAYGIVDIAMGPDGFGRIGSFAVSDMSGNPSRWVDYIQCTNSSCGAYTTQRVSSTSLESLSLTVPDDNQAILAAGSNAYGEADLHYIQCSSADCSTYDDNPIQNDWSTGVGVSMIAGQDSQSRIVATDSQLRVNHVRKTVSVKITLRSGSSLNASNDDFAIGTYLTDFGTTQLGKFIFTRGTQIAGCLNGIEAVGKLSSSSYQGKIKIRRRYLDGALWVDGLPQNQSLRSNSGDTSLNAFRDDDPYSGGSQGVVYDLDAPGPISLFGPIIKRSRQNFVVWAEIPNTSGIPNNDETLDHGGPYGTRVSPMYYFYVRGSCSFAPNLAAPPQWDTTVPGDNEFWLGRTNVSSDLVH